MWQQITTAMTDLSEKEIKCSIYFFIVAFKFI